MIMKANWDSIMMKIRAATEGDVVDFVDNVVNNGTKQFVDILTSEMRSAGVPESVIEDAASLQSFGGEEVYKYRSHKGLKSSPDGFYGKIRIDVPLTFEDVSRWSFSGGPVRTIVSLFNTGYRIRGGKLPAGEWHGDRVIALRSRPRLGFVESAMRMAKNEIKGMSKISKIMN